MAKRILVVEDDEKSRRLLTDVLEYHGFDVLAVLRAESAGASMPVIAVTASVMDQDRKKILSAGFDAYVPKPVNIRELVTVLNDLLANKT